MFRGLRNQADEGLWKKIWSTSTTPRCRMFLWRFCNKAIAVKSSLIRRGMHVEDRCDICRAATETGTHALRDCILSAQVWNSLPFGKIILGPSSSDPLEWIRYIAWFLSEKDWIFAVFCLWELWNQRNKGMRGDHMSSPQEIVAYVSKYMADYEEAQHTHRTRISPFQNPRIQAAWKNPPPGWIKINCDATLDLQSGRAGVGIILRNHEGSVIECAAFRKPPINSVAILEAMAIYDGLVMARSYGADQIMVESDAEIVVNSINSGNIDYSVFGHFTESIRAIRASFTEASFCFVNKAGNQAANAIARHCLTSPDSKQWFYCFPEFISDYIHLDVENCNLVLA